MKGSGGSVTRGYLRPGFTRSPPVLMAGLLIIAGISAFNYWNLSAQYGDLVKEIADLQDHIRVATMKRENAEKRIDALQQRLRESEDQLGHLKITADQRTRELAESLRAKQFHSKQSETLRTQLREVTEKLKNLTSLQDELLVHKRELEKWKFQNSLLMEKNSVLQLSLTDTKAQLSNVISQNEQSGGWKVPPIRQIGRIKTADDVPGQLGIVRPGDVIVEDPDINKKVTSTPLEKGKEIVIKAASSSNIVKEDFEDIQDGQSDPKDRYNEIDLNLDGPEPSENVAKVKDISIGADQLEEDDGANTDGNNDRLPSKGNSLLVGSVSSSTSMPNKINYFTAKEKNLTLKPNPITEDEALQVAALGARLEVANDKFNSNTIHLPEPEIRVAKPKPTSRVVNADDDVDRLGAQPPAVTLSVNTKLSTTVSDMQDNNVPAEPNGVKNTKKGMQSSKHLQIKDVEVATVTEILTPVKSGSPHFKNRVDEIVTSASSQTTPPRFTTAQYNNVDNHVQNQEMRHIQF